jgi:hypothetical protein
MHRHTYVPRSCHDPATKRCFLHPVHSHAYWLLLACSHATFMPSLVLPALQSNHCFASEVFGCRKCAASACFTLACAMRKMLRARVGDTETRLLHGVGIALKKHHR